MIIISSSYFVLKDWEKVVYGFVTPVSYTHLDVYKRQVYTYLKNILLRENVMAAEDNAWGPAHEMGHVHQAAINLSLIHI